MNPEELLNNTLKDIMKVVDRIELIDEAGRVYVRGSIYGTPVKVVVQLQDANRTLKIFVDKRQ